MLPSTRSWSTASARAWLPRRWLERAHRAYPSSRTRPGPHRRTLVAIGEGRARHAARRPDRRPRERPGQRAAASRASPRPRPRRVPRPPRGGPCWAPRPGLLQLLLRTRRGVRRCRPGGAGRPEGGWRWWPRSSPCWLGPGEPRDAPRAGTAPGARRARGHRPDHLDVRAWTTRPARGSPPCTRTSRQLGDLGPTLRASRWSRSVRTTTVELPFTPDRTIEAPTRCRSAATSGSGSSLDRVVPLLVDRSSRPTGTTGPR